MKRFLILIAAGGLFACAYPQQVIRTDLEGVAVQSFTANQAIDRFAYCPIPACHNRHIVGGLSCRAGHFRGIALDVRQLKINRPAVSSEIATDVVNNTAGIPGASRWIAYERGLHVARL